MSQTPGLPEIIRQTVFEEGLRIWPMRVGMLEIFMVLKVRYGEDGILVFRRDI